MRGTALLLMVLASATVPIGLAGQAPDTLTIRVALARMRAEGGGTAPAAFLTQVGRSRSSRELDELADSLVAIARSYRADDPASRRDAFAAGQALLSSADPQVLAERSELLAKRGLPAPVPYPRAFEALVRVFKGTVDPGMRGGTLFL